MARTYASPTRYRKRQVIATASMKPLMCIMIVFTVMFAIFFPTTGDPALVFSSMMGSTYTQGNALSNWQVARDTGALGDSAYLNGIGSGGGVVIDINDIYSDGAATAAGYSSSAVATMGYLKYGKNSPTYDIGSAGGSPYIVNLKPLYTQAISDMMQVEKDILGDGTSYKSVEEYVDSILLSGRWYETYGDGDIDYLGHNSRNDGWVYEPGDFGLHGSFGQALAIRNWYTDKYWTKGNPSGSDVWASVGGNGLYKSTIKNASDKSAAFNANQKVNLLVVSADDMDAYYNDPNSVTVYFIEFTPFDTKRHSQPWGMFQSWAANEGTDAWICRRGTSGNYAGDNEGYRTTIDATDSSYAYWKKVVTAAVNSGDSNAMYGVPYVEQNYSCNPVGKSVLSGGMNVMYVDKYTNCGASFGQLLNMLGGGSQMVLVGIMLPGMDIPK